MSKKRYYNKTITKGERILLPVEMRIWDIDGFGRPTTRLVKIRDWVKYEKMLFPVAENNKPVLIYKFKVYDYTTGYGIAPVRLTNCQKDFDLYIGRGGIGFVRRFIKDYLKKHTPLNKGGINNEKNQDNESNNYMALSRRKQQF